LLNPGRTRKSSDLFTELRFASAPESEARSTLPVSLRPKTFNARDLRKILAPGRATGRGGGLRRHAGARRGLAGVLLGAAHGLGRPGPHGHVADRQTERHARATARELRRAALPHRRRVRGARREPAQAERTL